MNLLILGGTQFVGRHITEAALQRGHTVTLFNRGKTNADLFPDVEKIHGDRSNPNDLKPLAGRAWDAVIDVNGYLPRQVRQMLAALDGRGGHYVYISSISVYADFSQPMDEDSPLAELADPATEEITNETYGALKAACERALPEGAAIVRPSYIVGPHDHTDRFTYWPLRVARGGQMLTPPPNEAVTLVDARDLAAFTLKLTEERKGGVYNATQTVSFGEVLETSRRLSGSDAEFITISEQIAKDRGVLGRGLPVWNPGPEEAGVNAIVSRRAAAAGLVFRPLADTIRDTLAWAKSRPADYVLKAGLTTEQEAALLEELS
ncbi:MAG: NAD-dependent epimerase/dehydratase family protein [Anaerolineae bacterium]|nr:MAG: NAD-dependent epimerase/dehydratase family protein [Anaerolineae bacterium]